METRCCVLGVVAAAALLMVMDSTSSTAADDRTCEAWAALKAGDRRVIVGSLLEQRVGRPESSRLAGCLWSIGEQIAAQTTDICARDGGAYVPALRHALDSAVDFCESKGAGASPAH